MANIIFLAVAAILLIKDQKKTKLTFNKRKW
ncbi:small membrane protein [Klebsiella michiganensis]